MARLPLAGIGKHQVYHMPRYHFLIPLCFALSLEQKRIWIQMPNKIIHVSDDSFEQEVLESEKPVLIDYWAEWCGPCKMIAPVLDELADEYADKVQVAKLNIDDNPATPPKYGIRGIPTLMLFKNGEVEATKVGAVSKTQLAAFLDEHL